VLDYPVLQAGVILNFPAIATLPGGTLQIRILVTNANVQSLSFATAFNPPDVFDPRSGAGPVAGIAFSAQYRTFTWTADSATSTWFLTENAQRLFDGGAVGQAIIQGIGGSSDLRFKAVAATAPVTVTSDATDVTLGYNGGLADQSDVTLTAPSDGQVLTYDNGTSMWVNESPTTGEVNTASNVGSGDGWFKQKTGTDLEFKSVLTDSALSVTNNTNDLTLGYVGSLASQSDTGTVSGGKLHVLAWNQASASWIGAPGPCVMATRVFTAGAGPFILDTTADYHLLEYAAPAPLVTFQMPQIAALGTINSQWQYHFWIAGSNVTTVTFVAAGIDTFGAGGPGSISLTGLVDTGITFVTTAFTQWNIMNFNTNATNLGAGSQVFKSKTGAELELRSIAAGTGIGVAQGADEITISNTGPTTLAGLSDTTIAAPAVGDALYYFTTGPAWENRKGNSGQVKVNSSNSVKPTFALVSNVEQQLIYDATGPGVILDISGFPTTSWPQNITTPVDGDFYDSANNTFIENLVMGQINIFRIIFDFSGKSINDTPTLYFIIRNTLSGFEAKASIGIGSNQTSGTDLYSEVITIADGASLPPAGGGAGIGYELHLLSTENMTVTVDSITRINPVYNPRS
jgi:hypothetical protein